MLDIQTAALQQKFQEWNSVRTENIQTTRAQQKTQATITSILEKMPRLNQLPSVQASLEAYVGRHKQQESWSGWLKQGADKAMAKTTYGTDFQRDIVKPYRHAVEVYVRDSSDVLENDKQSLLQQIQDLPIGKLDGMDERGSLSAVTEVIEGVFLSILQTEENALEQVFLHEEKTNADQLKTAFIHEMEHCITEAKASKYEMYSGEQPPEEYAARMPTFTQAMKNIEKFDGQRQILEKILIKHLKGKSAELLNMELNAKKLDAMIWALSYFSHLRQE